MAVQYGLAEAVRPGLRRLVAPNPSPMTGPGTNTWILGRGRVAVIDPGPGIASHLRAILGALAPGERVSHILVTHAHADHSALAPALARATGAPVLAFGDAGAGRPEIPAAAGLPDGEGVDAGFVPDIRLADGEVLAGDGWSLTALHTPGHFGNHLCFLWEDAAFSGDHVMGWSTSLVSPPEGDMGAYMASLARLAERAPRTLYPGHGAVVGDGAGRISDLIAHRRAREAEVLAALAAGPADPASLARMIYHGTAPELLPAAARNVLAHLIDLAKRNRVRAEAALGPDTRFRLT